MISSSVCLPMFAATVSALPVYSLTMFALTDVCCHCVCFSRVYSYHVCSYHVCRLFKLPDLLEPFCEDYGQTATYKGSIISQSSSYALDAFHTFKAGDTVAVCGNIATMLGQSWLAPHFTVSGDKVAHKGMMSAGYMVNALLVAETAAATAGNATDRACCPPAATATGTATPNACCPPAPAASTSRGCCPPAAASNEGGSSSCCPPAKTKCGPSSGCC